MREAERRLADVARRQHGLVTRQQARAAGLSSSAWGRRLERGPYVAVYPGVARHVSVRVTDEQHILAFVLAVGGGAAASHTAGARVWGALLEPWGPEVTVVGRDRSSRLRGGTVHRVTTGEDLTPVWRRRIPTTRPVRVLFDLASIGQEGAVEEALDVFVVRRLVDLAALHRSLDEGEGRGRRGVAALRQVVARWSLPGAFADSRLEVVMAELCAAHGLPTPSFHHRVGPYELDVAFPEQRVAVELDSWRFHGGREAFEADRARDLALQARGWVVSRLTWLAVTTRPGRVAGQLRQVLEGRSAA